MCAMSMLGLFVVLLKVELVVQNQCWRDCQILFFACR